MKTSILLLVFNRPEQTRQVLASVRKAQPSRLYVAADGPRASEDGEEDLCAEVRELFTKGIDWPCQLQTLFRDRNLGCREAVSSAITWFFEHEEEGIILEDDCIPAPDFYRFCELALTKWRDDTRVMHVGGNVLLEGDRSADMQISHLVPIWGWATWRRAWHLYDSEMTLLPRLSQLPLKDWFGGQKRNVIRTIKKVHARQMNVWGARWALTVVANEGLSILPRVNLISNIGFGDNATHTDVYTNITNLPVGRLPSNIKIPEKMETNPSYDEASLEIINKLAPRILRTLIRWLKALRLIGTDRG